MKTPLLVGHIAILALSREHDDMATPTTLMHDTKSRGGRVPASSISPNCTIHNALRVTRCIVGVAFLLLVSSPSMAGDAVSLRDRLDSIESAFNEHPRAVRAEHPVRDRNVCVLKGMQCVYTLSGPLRTLARSGSQFRIGKILLDEDAVRLELRDQDDKIGLMWVRFEPGTDEKSKAHGLESVLKELFEFGEAPVHRTFSGNKSSLRLHVASCNHLPSVDEREDFDDEMSAIDDGYSLCPICFPVEKPVDVPYYGLSRRRAVEAARTLELVNPPLEDAERQAWLRGIGEEILSDFPVPLRGFQYQLTILRSNFADARSLPTGFVYISDRLLDSVEYPVELQFVVAHEIAHCEVGNLLSSPASGWHDHSWWTSYYKELRDQEHEADVLALWFIENEGTDPQRWERAAIGLKKTQVDAADIWAVEDESFATHPPIADRLVRFAPDSFHFLKSQKPFEAWNVDSPVGATLWPVAVEKRGLRSVIWVLATSAKHFPENLTITEIRIQPVGIGYMELDRLTEKCDIVPGDRRLLAFGTRLSDRKAVPLFECLRDSTLSKLDASGPTLIQRWKSVE